MKQDDSIYMMYGRNLVVVLIDRSADAKPTEIAFVGKYKCHRCNVCIVYDMVLIMYDTYEDCQDTNQIWALTQQLCC